MSHQTTQTRLNEKKVSCPSPSQSPVQSSSDICIKQEYFEDKLFPTNRTVKTEPQSPSNQHNLLELIKTRVIEEHSYNQDCPELKRELDYDEGEQMDTERPVKRQQSERMNGADGVVIQPNTQIHNDEKPFKCSWNDCDIAFSKASNLRAHIFQVHSGQKPFKCTWVGCDKSFARNSNLQNHLRVHTGERPFACDWPGCASTFNHSTHLRNHMLSHTGERPYTCDWPFCGKKFARKFHLTRHYKHVHK